MAQKKVDNGLPDELVQGNESEHGLKPEIESHTELSAEAVVDERPPRKGSGMRLLLVILLLIAIGGIGLYLFGQSFVSTDVPVAAVETQNVIKIKIPARPVEAPAEGVKIEVIPSEKVSVVDTAPVIVKAEEVNPVEPPKVEVKPAFVLTSGGYLYAAELNKAVVQIEKMGFNINRITELEAHQMTRLFVGRYPLKAAKKRLAEIKPLAEGAFIIEEKGMFALYAGSFLLLEKARLEADHLYQAGVRTDEMKVTVDLPKTTLSFGNFDTSEAALQAANTLKALGVMDPQVRSKN